VKVEVNEGHQASERTECVTEFILREGC